MNLLAIETSTDACSVALLSDSNVLVDHRVAAQQHGALVIPMVDAIMAKAQLRPSQLDGLVFGRGPGSFTGVRIGVALAQGIALGADIGVVGISTLHSVAQGAFRVHGEKKVAVCLDARMKEVYLATFELDDSQLMLPSGEEYVCPPEDIVRHVSKDKWCWVGNGADCYAEHLFEDFAVSAHAIRGEQGPNAQDHLALAQPLIKSGKLLAPEDAMPVYLRNKVAQTTAERERSKQSG